MCVFTWIEWLVPVMAVYTSMYTHTYVHEYMYIYTERDLSKKLLGNGVSTPYTLFCFIGTIDSELNYFPDLYY